MTNLFTYLSNWKLKYFCALAVLLFLGVGNVWGATDTQEYDGGDLADWTGTHSGQYNDGSLKMDATGEYAIKTNIWSGTISANMTSLSVTINYKMNGSGSMTSNVFTVAAVNSSGTVKASQTFTPNNTSYDDKTVTLTIPASSAVTGLKITYTTKGNRNVAIASLSATATYTVATSVTASPTSITFDDDELDGSGEASGSTTLDLSVSNGYKSSGNYLNLYVESDDEDKCEFTINSGAYSYSSGNSTSIDDLSVEYYAIDAGTFTGRVIASGYNSSYAAVNCTIPLSVTITAGCSYQVALTKGAQTNGSFFWTPLFEPLIPDNSWPKTHTEQLPYFLGPISYPTSHYIYYVYIP